MTRAPELADERTHERTDERTDGEFEADESVEPAPPRELDARLAVGAVAGWAAVLMAQRSSWPVVAVGAAACLVGGLIALAVGRPRDLGGLGHPERGGAVHAVVAVALFCIGGVLLPLTARLWQIQASPLTALVVARASVVVDARVTADPRRLGTVIGSGDRGDGGVLGVAVPVRLTAVRTAQRHIRLGVPAVVLARSDGWARLVPGQRVHFDAQLGPARLGDLLAASLTAHGPPQLVGHPPWWQRWAEPIRAGLRQASSGLPEPERGLLPGLVDGDTSGLDPLLVQQFRTAGLTHLVAVSGTNVAIVVGAVLLVLRRLRAPPWLCAAGGTLMLLAFVVVARPSPSVLRAAVMAGVLLAALASGRARSALPALALAVLALLAWQPVWARAPGFAMSVSATAALLVLAPGWAEALRRRRVPVGLAEGTAVAVAAGLVTAPVIVLLNGQISLVSVPANLLAEIAVAPATVLGVLAGVSAPWCPPLGAAFAQAAGVPCRWLTRVAGTAAALPGATLPWPASLTGAIALVLVAAVIVTALRIRRLRIPLAAALVTFVVVQVPVRMWIVQWPVRAAILVACDVGQGDGLVIPITDHAAVVIDDGRDPVPIDRCLRSLGVTQVPVLVLSHFDLDHVGGTPGVTAGRRVGSVFTSPLQEPTFGHGIVHRVLDPRGIATSAPPLGTTVQVGRVRLQVLASRAAQLDGKPDSNDSSLIVRAEVAGRSVLLLGDAAEEEQGWLLDHHVPVAVDVLKVAHHGSAHFDPDLYAATHASLAVISVGAHNTYGHPTPRVLQDLARLSMPVVRTDQQGDIAVVSTDAGLRTVSHASHQTPRAAGVAVAGSAPSPARATMARWLPELLRRRPATAVSRLDRRPVPAARWFWSSATRSSSSSGPSSRSPPSAARTIRAPRPPRSTDRQSSRRSCTSYWARRCSAGPARWSCVRLKTCPSQPYRR